MNSEQQIEWIEQYLEGKLTGEELKAFEQKMADDPSFAAEVKLQREIAEAMTEKDVIELSSKIRSVLHQKKTASAGSGRIFLFRRLLQIAAAVVLLLVVYFVYENYTASVTPQQLAAKYLSPEDHLTHPVIDRDHREPEDTAAIPTFPLKQRLDALWAEVDTLYIQKKYAQALEKFTALQNLDPAFIVQSPDEFHFYQGFLLLLNDQPAMAIPHLKKVQIEFTEKATWYLALCYLQLGDTGNAKKQLEKILSVEKHPFKQSAEELMRDMNSLNPS